MLSFLKDHPFGVDAFFDESLVISFAVAKEELAGFLPPCLTLDTFGDKWAFIAVAMVQTRALRPAGFPKWFGNDFFLIGYRLFVRYTDNAGKRLRGLFILRSETNRRKMQFLGNVFTHYNYRTTDITSRVEGAVTKIFSARSKIQLTVDQPDADISVPSGSPFHNWKEARRFAGPLPFTFTYNEQSRKVTIIEGVREHWQPEPVRVVSHSFAFLDELKLQAAVLANAFVVRNIPYHWKKGRTEIWNG